MNDAPMLERLMTAICAAYASVNQKASFVQIGANDGRINDPVHDVVFRNVGANRILLIEPQADIIPFLEQTYASHPDHVIWTGAIGAADQMSLFRLKSAYHAVFRRRYLQDSPLYRVPSGFTSTDRDHVLRHVAGNLPADVDPQQAIEEIVVPCARLLDVLQGASWPPVVDVLQVDTEGADDDTLYASNLETLRPAVIHFEYMHVPRTRLDRLQAFLTGLGYRIQLASQKDALAVHPEKCRPFGITLR